MEVRFWLIGPCDQWMLTLQRAAGKGLDDCNRSLNFDTRAPGAEDRFSGSPEAGRTLRNQCGTVRLGGPGACGGFCIGVGGQRTALGCGPLLFRCWPVGVEPLSVRTLTLEWQGKRRVVRRMSRACQGPGGGQTEGVL